MYDLIKQIEHAAAGSITEEIRLLKQHRKSLDHVIKFTLGINRLQLSLESVLLLKKPTKEIPRDLLNVLGKISDGVANLPSNELMKRLNRIEDSIKSDMDNIMGITKNTDTIDTTTPNQAEDISDKLQLLINDFRRRINTAIVLKLHMRTRGIKVSETTIPVTAEELVTQVSKLVVEEKRCRTKTQDELQSMGTQMDALLKNKDCPDAMKQYTAELQQQIKKNIEHLNKGRDIEKMPFVLEIIQMGENDKETNDSAGIEKDISPIDDATTEANENKLSFFGKVERWMSTPWSVKWKDIK